MTIFDFIGEHPLLSVVFAIMGYELVAYLAYVVAHVAESWRHK